MVLLRAMAQKYPVWEIARRLRRTESAIRSKATRDKVTLRKRTRYDIAKEHNVHHEVIRRICKKLGFQHAYKGAVTPAQEREIVRLLMKKGYAALDYSKGS
jgi:methylmalonyl-CoA mutase cobalamin-binding subunit